MSRSSINLVDNPWTLVEPRKKKITERKSPESSLYRPPMNRGLKYVDSSETDINERIFLKEEPPKNIVQEQYERYLDRTEDGKISEPCWFYNNGGCKHKDGTEKTANECKYIHTYSENVKRPPHLNTKKPCDKFNLEGDCKWYDNCKYSHRNLTSEEWSRYYPGIPFTLKTNIQKRQQLEAKVFDIENRVKILEFKQEGISKDVQQIGQTLHNCVRHLKALINQYNHNSFIPQNKY